MVVHVFFQIIHVCAFLTFGLDHCVKRVSLNQSRFDHIHSVHFTQFSAVRILWTFDNNLLEFYGNYPGTPVNNPSYSTPGINGYGSCLYLNRSVGQSVTVPEPPFLNMAYTSFSLSAWVKANSLRSGCPLWNPCCDNAIFGQFDQNTKSRSLHIIVREKSIYFGFYSDDTQGNLVLQTGAWYHVRRSFINPFDFVLNYQ